MKNSPINVRVLDVRPHPDQATHNPGTWAVQFQVSHAGTTRSFWRWHTIRELKDGRHVTPSSEKKPARGEIIAAFWDDIFSGLHGFDFKEEDP